MPVITKIKSDNVAETEWRTAKVQRVITCFGNSLPNTRLLCFLDDEDPLTLKSIFGVSNRGIYGPIHDQTRLGDFPHYVIACIYFDDGVSWKLARVIDDLVYLCGSTWTNEVGMAMTLAHELQHAIQHANLRKFWAVNSLVRHVQPAIEELHLEWADIPTEREARSVGKRIAIEIYGEHHVDAYIQTRIAEATEPHELVDWQFIEQLTPSNVVDVAGDTHSLFQRLRPYRVHFESVLEKKKGDPDFRDVDFDEFF